MQTQLIFLKNNIPAIFAEHVPEVHGLRYGMRSHSMDYGGQVAVVYICDSHSENWSVGKDCMGNEIPVIKIVTSPEIEILLVYKEKSIQKWKNARAGNRQLHVSSFCRQILKMDVKNGENFIEQFSSIEDFKNICAEYKKNTFSSGHKMKNEMTWYDLLK